MLTVCDGGIDILCDRGDDGGYPAQAIPSRRGISYIVSAHSAARERQMYVRWPRLMLQELVARRIGIRVGSVAKAAKRYACRTNISFKAGIGRVHSAT